MRRRKECPYCGEDFDSLGIASHRAACRDKNTARKCPEHPHAPPVREFVMGKPEKDEGWKCSICGKELTDE